MRRLALFIVLVTCAPACGEMTPETPDAAPHGPPPPPDTTPPVATLSPPSGARLGESDVITVTFDEPIRAAYGVYGPLTAASQILVERADDRTLRIHPATQWTPGAGQELYVSAADLSGNGTLLRATYDLEDRAPALLAISSPVRGTDTITIRFDQTVEPASLVLGGSLMDIGHDLAWTRNDTVAIKPHGAWYAGAQQVTVSVADPTGHVMGPVSAPVVVVGQRAFVTSAAGVGRLADWPQAGGKTGVDAGDAVCQTLADTAGLGGQYLAVLRTDATDFFCRWHGVTGTMADNCGGARVPRGWGPWVRVDGEPFAGNLYDLMASNVVYTPIALDEHGAVVPDDTRVFTGGRFAGYACGDWKNTTDTALAGFVNGTAGAWLEWSREQCTTSARLLCLETGQAAYIRPRSPAGHKLVFVTRGIGTGDMSTWAGANGQTGRAAADAVCRSEAAALPGAATFVALLSTSTSSAASRIPAGSGPWYRPDGYLVALDKADLFGGSPTNTPHVTPGLAYANKYAWTGADRDGTSRAETCDDWKSGLATVQGAYGYPGLTDAVLFAAHQPCNITSLALVCIQP